MRTTKLAVAAALALVACGGGGTPADLGVVEDQEVALDQAVDVGAPDRVRADRPRADAGKGDAAARDLAKADLPRKDLIKVDAVKLDQKKADAAKVDLVKADIPRPDLPKPKPDMFKVDSFKTDAAPPPPPWAPPKQIDVSASKEQELQLALDGQGNLYAVWIQASSIATSVIATRRDAATGSWSQPKALDASASDEKQPRIAIDGQGNVYVAWIQVSSISTSVIVTRRDVATGSWSQPVSIDLSAADEDELVLAVSPQGDVYAAWIELSSIASSVVITRRDRVTGSWSQPQDIDVSATDERDLALAVDAAGNVYAGWIAYDSISSEVQVRRRDATTGLWGSVQKPDLSVSDESELRLGLDAQGNLYAAWIEDGAIDTDVMVARRDQATGAWSSPQSVDSGISQDQQLGLAIDAPGNVYAIWLEVDSISTEVVVARRDKTTGVWNNVRVDWSASDETEPRLAIDGAGQVYAAWISVSSITTDVTVSRRDPVAGTWTKPQDIDISASKEKDLRLAAGPARTFAGYIEVSSITTGVMVSTFPYP